MQCTACGTALIAGKRFCHACGTAATVRCRQCGANLDPGWAFCPDCGFRVASADAPPTPAPDDPLGRFSRDIPSGLAQKIRAAQGVIEGERKVVTVLFCDLAGSTAIAERLDPEEYHELLERYLALAFREIYRLEGIVNQLAGDGMMALFGAPVAHEDAPERAIRAALAVNVALAGLRAERGIDLQARVGIHTGPVVVGTVGNDLKMDYTAIGDTTNLAARLESLAPPGGILVSEDTQRLTRGLFEFRPTGPLAVKGKREPVSAYEVLGEIEAATPMTIAAERGLTPLRGRDDELAVLDAGFARLAAGTPQVVAIVGGAGSGKSRLLYEFTRRLPPEGAVVLEGRCSSLSQTVPYYPFTTMFAQHLRAKVARGESRGDVQRAIEEAYPNLLRFVRGDRPRGDDAPADDVKREALTAVTRMLLSLAERLPVVVLLEDLHWADEPSRELVERLLGRLGTGRVMLVMSERPGDQAGWRTPAAFTQLVLGRLSDADTVAMIRAIAGRPLPPGLEAALVTKAEGSPFFTEEIVRGLIESGLLDQGDGNGGSPGPLADIPIPGTIQEVIAARLDRLGPPAKRVVQVAAALGRQFSRSRLAAVLADESIDVARELAEVERRGLIHRKHVLTDDEYRFGESLTQEVAYEGLLLRQRRALHTRIGTIIEQAAGEPDAERLALLAHHFGRSDDRDRGVAALLAAARAAEQVPSYRTAGDLFRRAWEVAEAALAEQPSDDRRRAVVDGIVGLVRVSALFGSQHMADAERAAIRGRELLAALDDPQALATLTSMHASLVGMADRSRFAEGLAIGESALAMAERAGATPVALGIARGLAINLALDGQLERARRLLAPLLDALAQVDPHSPAYLGGHWVSGAIRYLADDLDGAAAEATDTRALAIVANNRTIQSATAATLAQVSFVRGDTPEAQRWADTALDLAEAIGNSAVYPSCAAISLATRLEGGASVAPDRYVALMEQGLGGGGISQLNVRFVGETLLALGDVERAAYWAERWRDALGGRLREAFVASLLGDVRARAGRLDDAERHYAEAIAGAEAIGARSVLAVALVGAAETTLARGEPERGLAPATRALAIIRGLDLGRYRPRVERVLLAAETRVDGTA